MNKKQKQNIINAIRDIYNTSFMKKNLKTNSNSCHPNSSNHSDYCWLEYLKTNYNNMSKEERLNYIMGINNEDKGFK